MFQAYLTHRNEGLAEVLLLFGYLASSSSEDAVEVNNL